MTAQCDAPEPWLIGFQDGASPTFEGITELHNTIFFYLIVIGVAVGWMLCSIVVNFNESRSPIAHRYANHGTLIEVVWTVTPALVLVAIAFPSFKLLYLMDFLFLILIIFLYLPSIYIIKIYIKLLLCPLCYYLVASRHGESC
jgi:cytochrome c oxidase subunit 2